MKQRDQTDCGATCLAYLCKRWGRPRPVALLRQWAGTDQNGTTALGLLQAGERSGLRMRGVKASPRECDQLPLPAVAHVVQGTRQLHYVVIEKVGTRSARVMDPAVGKVESWKREKLTASCTGVFLLASKGDESPNTASGSAGLSQTRRWLDLLKPHRALLGQALVGALLATILGLAMSLYVEKLVDSVIPEQDTRMLFLLGWVMVGVIAARVTLSWLQGRLSLRIAQRIDAYLILGYYRHLLRLPKSFHDSMRVGERMARVADAAKIRSFLNQTLVNLCLHPLMVAASLAALFLYDWRLGLLAGGLLAFHALAYPLVHKVNGVCQRRIAVRLAEWQSHLTESLQAQSSVRALGLASKELLRAEQHLVRVLKATRSGTHASLGVGLLTQGGSQLYLLTTLWCGAWLVLNQHLSLGELMSAYTMAGFLVGPVSAIMTLNSAVQEALVATDRLYEIMDLEPESDGGTRVLSAANFGEICFDDVTLQHPGRLPTLTHVSFRIPAGKLTVLTGPSGGGKSSVLSLLQRHLQPAQGRITLASVPLELFSRGGLVEGMAVLPQQVELFTGTVLENLVPDGSEPDLDRLLLACREAGIGTWIQSQAGMFNACLQEGGANLSGGQRQRLALARTFYRLAPLMLLDEPSSALDAVSEVDLVAAVRRRVNAGVTVIVASHAERFLKEADHVIRIVDGRVA